jgi:hypothetical protein
MGSAATWLTQCTKLLLTAASTPQQGGQRAAGLTMGPD